jgi:hypothetical protein
VPKSGSLGSARGALSNGRPYREHHPVKRTSFAGVRGAGLWARLPQNDNLPGRAS